LTSYDREHRKKSRTRNSRVPSLDPLKLKIYTEKALSLYNASINPGTLDSSLMEAYEKDIKKYLGLEGKLGVYNTIRAKAEEFALLGNLERKVYYESAALYFMMRFV